MSGDTSSWSWDTTTPTDIGKSRLSPNYDASVATQIQAEDLIAQTDAALTVIGTANLNVGQFSNNIGRTLELQRANDTSITNAESNLMDTNMATEATALSKEQIIAQSAIAMQAQANLTNQFVLQLIRNSG